MKSQTKKMKELADVMAIQGQNGNWNYDPYMMGLYNGMEMARSIFAENEPVFKNKPERWLHDKTIIGKLKYWWLVKTGKSTTPQPATAELVEMKGV